MRTSSPTGHRIAQDRRFGLRALARVLGAINQQGVEVVGKALERALETGNSTPMGLIPLPVREYPYGKV